MSERDVFDAARGMTDPAARSAYLDGACGGDPELRSRVEALLRAHDGHDSLLDQPTLARPEHDPATARTIAFEEGETGHDEVPLGFLSPATRADSLGRIGHYEVLQVLGQGGFGIVFRAFDDVLHRVVAVKVLSPLMAATSPARKRFLREARSSAQVRHENVVQVYEVGEQPLPYIAMEFIPGETLQQRLDRTGPIDVLEVVRIGRQVAEGLAAAHATDLIHRDIKPGNILLEGGQLRVKLTDFGLARAADDASISQSGIIAGTPMFMAPEQAKGETLDQRADLFSLGSVLYVMASGRPPFRANNTVAVLKRVAEDTPRPIREIIPETPQWLCDIIAKLHAKDPDERFQSAREVADVLADCEAQLKANSRLRDFSRIPLRKSQPAGGRKWVAAAVLLLPVIALVATELAGLTHLIPTRQAAHDPIKARSGPTSIQVSRREPPPLAVAPFDATQARKHQEAWAKPLGVPVEYTNSIGMKFVAVPKGRSWLGGGKDRLGAQEVEIPADFFLGEYEVTQGEWEKVMGEKPSHFSRTGDGKDAVKDIPDADLKRFPLENVSWDQCQAFVAKLNELEKGTGWVYRLPRLTEWEYACRGGPMAGPADSAFDYYSTRPTNTLSPEDANFGKRMNRTCKVGSYQSNPLGLFDLHGNVQEWCEDREPWTSDGDKRLRGGSYRMGQCEAKEVTAAQSTFRADDLGLRLARVPAGAPSPEAKTPPLAVAPFTDVDTKRIAALPAAEQVEEVRKELMRRNPGFDGEVEHQIEDGVVTEIRVVTDKATDISPLRVFNALRVLDCSGTEAPDWHGNGQLADLTPLKGMNLGGLKQLNLNWTQVGDAGLSCFQDCKNLTHLKLYGSQVGDAGMANFKDCKNLMGLWLGLTKVSSAGLIHFQNCKNLEHLGLPGTQVDPTGLAYFKDCKKLKSLDLSHTLVTNIGLANLEDCKDLTSVWLTGAKVTDLSPLKGMPLKQLACDFQPERDAEILRSIKTLETINAKPAAEFWRDVEQK